MQSYPARSNTIRPGFHRILLEAPPAAGSPAGFSGFLPPTVEAVTTVGDGTYRCKPVPPIGRLYLRIRPGLEPAMQLHSADALGEPIDDTDGLPAQFVLFYVYLYYYLLINLIFVSPNCFFPFPVSLRLGLMMTGPRVPNEQTAFTRSFLACPVLYSTVYPSLTRVEKQLRRPRLLLVAEAVGGFLSCSNNSSSLSSSRFGGRPTTDRRLRWRPHVLQVVQGDIPPPVAGICVQHCNGKNF